MKPPARPGPVVDSGCRPVLCPALCPAGPLQPRPAAPLADRLISQGVSAPWVALRLGLGRILGTHCPEAGVVTKVEVEMSTQRPVLLQRRPATAAGGIALVVAFPGELHARAPVALAAVAIHPPLDGDESETAGPVRAELNIAGP